MQVSAVLSLTVPVQFAVVLLAWKPVFDVGWFMLAPFYRSWHAWRSWPWLMVCALTGVSAVAQPHLQGWGQFESWVGSNVRCQQDFVAPVQDPVFLASLRRLGVPVASAVPDGPPEDVWLLNRPVSVLGYHTRVIRYWADSGSEFYVVLAASPQQLIRQLGAQALPQHMRKEDRYVAGVWMQKRSRKNPYPPLMFIRAGKTDDQTEVGCRTFDG